MVCQGEVNKMIWANFVDFECWGGGGTEKSVKFCKLGIFLRELCSWNIPEINTQIYKNTNNINILEINLPSVFCKKYMQIKL